ncbi:hypothetical protein PAPYR_6055 [Paratrimastix pyriformis]|uniref:CSC1/OSCA1-like N-terminal transmembrane domain-containing protein n=1 Tax=Paratrimastix pyriformis TaxID=342808 RepID=A0ABQ8UJW6_9EUKA|nr:hypothetical protein PAPYR_6055 [Paratrimastix pyriformis]
MACCDAYFRFIKRFRYFVLLFWLAIAICSGIFGLNIFSVTKGMQLNPPPGSPTDLARRAYHEQFEVGTVTTLTGASKLSSVVAFIHNRKDDNSVLGVWTQNFTTWIESKVKGRPGFVSVNGYYNSPKELQPQFVAGSHDSATVIVVTCTAATIRGTALWLQPLVVAEWPAPSPDWVVGLVGQDIFSYEAKGMAIRDFSSMDTTVLPLALAVLFLVLRSIRLLLVAPVTAFLSGYYTPLT